MSLIDFFNDVTGFREVAHGSDGRVNTSSRSDTRGYYNSRDESESYVLIFDDENVTNLDFPVYLRNDKTDGKHMVIRSASVNASANVKVSFLTVTGTAAGGTSATPANLNRGGVSRTAAVTALTTADSNATPMSGLTADVEFDHVNVLANGHEEFRFQDQVRLGQDQAIALRMDSGSADTNIFGVVFFYFERP